MEYQTYERDYDETERRRKERVRKVAIATAIFLGLSGGVYALNEATREESPIIPPGWTFDQDVKLLEKTVVSQVEATHVEVTDENGKKLTAYTVPAGYTLVGTKGVKTVVSRQEPAYEYPGIVERAYRDVVSLVKGRK